MSEHPLCDDPRCQVCAQRRTTAGFRSEPLDEPPPGRTVVCPKCSHQFSAQGAPQRVTESAPVAAPARLEYADEGRTLPLDTEDHVLAAWETVRGPGDQAARGRVKAAMRRHDLPFPVDARTEAAIAGKLSFDDIRDRVRKALRARATSDYPSIYSGWVYVLDLTDTDVVYTSDDDRLWQCSYSLDSGEVALGPPTEVQRTYAPVAVTDPEIVAEAVRDTTATAPTGRIVEAKGKTAAGGRIFGVQLIGYGTSLNGRRYTEAVLRAAAPLYEGARCYDHHRTETEHQTSTIDGLVGYFRNVVATAEGLAADLHLLPSATHAAEALDATVAAQQEGRPALIGLSHDAYVTVVAATEGGVQIEDCTSVAKVNSVDLVAEPAAKGQAQRVVAGGVIIPDPTGTAPTGESTKESDVAPTKADVLAALSEATVDELAAVGLQKAGPPAAPAKDPVTETGPGKTLEAGSYPRDGFLGRMLIRSKVEAAGFTGSAVDSTVVAVAQALPETITEAAVDAHIAVMKSSLAALERAGLAPSQPVKVTKEAHDKRVSALDAAFNGDFRNGYRSIKQAYYDITGRRPSFSVGSEDENRLIMRECRGHGFDSETARAAEAINTATFAQVLGDSIHRRMMREWEQPKLQSWRKVVSDVVPVSDFRDQKRPRIGGYGLLPVVNQGAPYQPLASPGDEEAVYAIIKRGGTEDLTWETIVNDDMGMLRRIPILLGRAAAITLYRFVWDLFVTNPATSYDAVAWFHASHGNTTAAAPLSDANLAAARVRMEQMAAYGDSNNILEITPRYLIVPSALSQLAYQLTASATAIPAASNDPADRPNWHSGMEPITVPYWTDANDWFVTADPTLGPTIEVGFYQGREDPELFTQADPNVGSYFDADKVTYKIRHVYNTVILDHRGVQRQTN